MIAWNGIERWKAGDRGLTDIAEMENIKVEPRVPLGPDVSEDIARFGLKVKTKDIDSLVEEASNMVKTREERGTALCGSFTQ